MTAYRSDGATAGSNVLVDVRYDLGEGARYVDGALYWVELLAGQLWSAMPEVLSPRLVLDLDYPLGAVAPHARGGWIAACGDGVALVRDGRVRFVQRPEKDAPTRMRMNDACVDPKGRFVVGSMAYDETPGAGRIYSVDLDGTISVLLEGLTTPNGPAFSTDGHRMYLADSCRRLIYVHEYEPSAGRAGPGQVFVQLDPDDGMPDGMTVDRDDGLWCAMWGSGQVRRYDSGGALTAIVDVPASQPTSCAFGGPDGAWLYITTASVGLAAPGRGDGRIFVCTSSGASGDPAARCQVDI